MKKTAILLATGLMMAVMPSCSDSDLDIENGNSLNTSNFWKTEEDAEKGLGSNVDDWKGGIAGPVKHAAIFDGEVYDAREQPGYLVADQPNNRCSSVLSR